MPPVQDREMRVDNVLAAGARGPDASPALQRATTAVAQDPEAPVRPVEAATTATSSDRQAEDLRRKKAADAAAAEPDGTALERTVKDMNRQLSQHATELNFQVDDASGKLVVKLVDVSTKQVLRQVPSVQAMKIAEELRQDPAKAGMLLRTDA
jgi:flagellar protein FlaG